VIGGAAAALARGLNWLYLDMANRRTAVMPFRRCRLVERDVGSTKSRLALMGWRMVEPISTPREIPGALRPARKAASAIVMAGAGLGVVLGLGAAVLWFHYGTAVFFETIASGLSACF
jgi:hypothetical protein